LERFGIHFVASPKHADMLLVTGPVTRNMAAALKLAYDAVPSPKLVVAVGACGCSGGQPRRSRPGRRGNSRRWIYSRLPSNSEHAPYRYRTRATPSFVAFATANRVTPLCPAVARAEVATPQNGDAQSHRCPS
jgi:coenzyme F420-reducing hydrogenase gamma subunit